MAKPTKRPARKPAAANGGEIHQTTTSAANTSHHHQGIPISDNQNTLKSGGCAARPCWKTSLFARRSPTSTMSAFPSVSSMPAARRRTAISKRRAVRANSPKRRSCSRASAPRYSPASRPWPGARVRSTRRATCAAFAVKFYTEEGNFDLVGNNIPVFFIQDAIKFPDLVHCGKDGARPWLPAVGDGPRHVLGFHLAHAREHEHGDVDHVGPHDSVLATSHRRIRRTYVPPYQCAGRVDVREVPLAANGRCDVDGVGRGGEDRRC